MKIMASHVASLDDFDVDIVVKAICKLNIIKMTEMTY